MYNSSSVCSVNYQSRAIVAQRASKERHRFIVGTCSLHDSNEISVLQYTEDSNHFESVAVYPHQDQVWAIETSPKDPSLVVTSRQSSTCAKSLTIWRMAKQTVEHIESDYGNSYNAEPLEIEEVATFNQSQKPSFVRSIKWHHNEDSLLTVDNKVLSCWRISDTKVNKINDFVLENENSWDQGCAAWDPHTRNQCAVGAGTSLQLVDIREMDIVSQKIQAHDENIKDIDYNPNKPQLIVTASEDRKIKFWDVRNLNKPIKTLAGHTHWVCGVKYNPFHDQLIISFVCIIDCIIYYISGGSDNLVNLWRIASCSSSPWIGSEDNSSNDPPDVKVRCVDQHEDSVYGLAWSPADAWIYCSLSYDGRVVVNHVPSTEKYKILL